jgi:hypothetical protein
MKPLLSITFLLAALVMFSLTTPQAAAQATTTTTLAASPNPIISGKEVTFTATVQTTGSSPLTGFVDLSINGNVTPGLGLVNGVATTTIPFSTVGTYAVVATYTGDPNNANSSATVRVAVQAALGLSPTTTTVVTSVNPAQVGEFLTYTATVAGNGASAPTGTVNFFFGSGTTPFPEPLGSNGTATATNAFPNPGDYEITASYSGDANNAGSTSVPVGQSVSTAGSGQGLSFVAVTPCRIADTRNIPPGPFSAPAITNNQTRSFPIPQSSCGIPSTAVAYSLNVTVVPNGLLNYLTVWPTGQTRPTISLMNSFDGRTKANAAIVAAGTAGSISVFASTPTSTNVILDIDGYFVPSTSASLAFYTVAPCRLVDTRTTSSNPPGPLAGPALAALQTRSFRLQSGKCNLPSNAQAYSLNVTAIPPNRALTFLVAFPTGQKQPRSSTLNAPTGTITANAAIVPAGTGGAVSVFTQNDTDLLLDVNGYFAPPGPGGLYLYTTTPCRIVDTRDFFPPYPGPFTIPIETSATCPQPNTAEAYVLNATILPVGGFPFGGPVQFLTIWDSEQAQPSVSTLNAYDGAVTSNMAIVPTNNGVIATFVPTPDTANLLLDISGYFAP